MTTYGYQPRFLSTRQPHEEETKHEVNISYLWHELFTCKLQLGWSDVDEMYGIIQSGFYIQWHSRMYHNLITQITTAPMNLLPSAAFTKYVSLISF